LFGIAGLNQIPYSPWLQPILITAMLINIVSVWLRARVTRQRWGLYLVSAGALIIIVAKMGFGWEKAAIPGVLLTLAGSVVSAMSSRGSRKTSTGLFNGLRFPSLLGGVRGGAQLRVDTQKRSRAG
jgi:drug/metabolite transporter (DMT)-like permease